MGGLSHMMKGPICRYFLVNIRLCRPVSLVKVLIEFLLFSEINFLDLMNPTIWNLDVEGA
jgi:hypothetical protein